MYAQAELDEYMAEIREQVCSHCIERPPGGPPCAIHGKNCGVELHLEKLITLCRETRSGLLDPYQEHFHADICTHCANRDSSQCPCPLDYLMSLAVLAIESVDQRHTESEPPM